MAKKPVLSIEDMDTIAATLSKETGHYHSYGDVQKAIEVGSINPIEILKRSRQKAASSN